MRWGLVALLWAGVASAGEVLIDDFEATNRLTSDAPPGPWATLDSYPNVSLTRSTAAARRGNAGLRLDDQASMMGAGDMTALYSPPLSLSQTASLRFWVRLTSTNARGGVTLGQLLSDLPDGRPFCDVGLELTTGQLQLNGADSAGAYVLTPSTVSFDAGSVMLVECAVRGMGSLAGERLLYANGVRVAEQRNLDLRDAGVQTAAIGQPYSADRRFVGVIDFDEVRVADRLQASRIWVDAGVNAFVRGECTPVDVGFIDSEGAPQPMPSDVLLSSTILQAQPFSDAACTMSSGGLVVPAGQTSVRFFVRAGINSPVTLDFSFSDLIGADFVRPIVAAGVDAGAPDAGSVDAGAPDAGAGPVSWEDAGVPAPPQALQVGCGCTAVPPFWLLGALALLLRATRRR